MEQQLINQIVSNGIFATLFVWLLFQTMKNNKAREEKYQETITQLSQSFTVMEEIKQDTQDLKTIIQSKEISNVK